MGDRSALIVPVPEAEPAVRRWRARHDNAAAAGVPAHVTLLVPFLAPLRIDAAAVTKLATHLDTARGFDFVLSHVARFPPGPAGGGVVYLAPDPAEPFVRLVDTLTVAYPDHPPYGGIHDEVIPHLTVAEHGSPEELSAAATDLAGRLPIECRAREIWLMTENAGRWSRHTSFPLR